MRTRIFNFTIICIFFVIVSYLFKLQVIQGSNYRELSNKNCIRLLPQEGSRGMILDRNGRVIADNRLSYDALVLPQEKAEAEKSLSVIAGVLGVNAVELNRRFKKAYSAPFIPVIVASDIGVGKAIALEELKSSYPNIAVRIYPRRHYPYGKLASHVLGYLGQIDHWRLTKLKDYGYEMKDMVGFGGVEEKYDYYLRQADGALSVEVDHRGQFVRVLGFKPPGNGKNIQLTLDLKIQQIVESALKERKGSVILLEPDTGEVLAMASSPAFEPALFMEPGNFAISSLNNSALINRAISSGFAPGSVFKLVTASCGLETGKIRPQTTYSCSGSTRIGNRQFGCWETHGSQDLAQAVIHSCNVFFYRAGLFCGPQGLHDYAFKFGLGKISGIDLPYEVSGFVPGPLWRRISKGQGWFDGDTANFSIGQGELLVTPLQAARFMAVFANGGSLVRPYILKGVAEKDISASQRKIFSVAVNSRIINRLREALRKVVSDATGTANVLAGLPVSVAGKTGTSQAGPNRTHGWFAGFFPFKEARFVICVFLENNASGHAASVVAKEIIDAMVKEDLV